MNDYAVLPQALSPTSSPTFAGLTITGTATFAAGMTISRVGTTECVVVGGTLTGAGLFSHAYADQTAFSSTGTGAYATIDSIPNMGGSIAYNHFYSFQSRFIYSGSLTLTTMASFVSVPTVSGPVTNLYGMLISDAAGVGVIDTQIGIWIEPFTRGTAKFAVYSGGTMPSYYGGYIQCGSYIIATKARFTDFSAYGAVITTDTDGYTLTNPNMTIINGVLTLSNGSTAKVLASAALLELSSTSGDVKISPGSGYVDIVGAADGAAAQIATMTNGPTAGNPAIWLKVKVGGAVRYIPAWA